jgi:hypothetical protein
LARAIGCDDGMFGRSVIFRWAGMRFDWAPRHSANLVRVVTIWGLTHSSFTHLYSPPFLCCMQGIHVDLALRAISTYGNHVRYTRTGVAEMEEEVNTGREWSASGKLQFKSIGSDRGWSVRAISQFLYIVRVHLLETIATFCCPLTLPTTTLDSCSLSKLNPQVITRLTHFSNNHTYIKFIADAIQCPGKIKSTSFASFRSR